jgi:acyl-CoA synthetase (AMP-forming)/AMP-acid ligase II
MGLLVRDLLARNAQLYGGDTAFVFRGATTTWAGLQERVFRLANRLRAEQVGPGDRVAVLQGNGPEIVELAFAAALTGAVLVPISDRLTADEATYVAEDAEVALAFVAPELGGRIAGVDAIPTGGDEYAMFVQSGDGAEPPALEAADDVVLQLYTSGTTGRPKGALLTQRAMVANALTTVRYQGLRHDDVYLTATPLTHAAGIARVFALAVDGLANVIHERFDPEAFVAAVRAHRVTSTVVVPVMLRALAELGEADRASLGGLTITYGAAPTPRPVIEEALERLPCRLFHAYGLTEGCPALTALGPDEHRGDLLGSIGRAVAGVRVRVGDGTPAPGDPAELHVRSDKTMVGYWRRPEETAAVLRDGWLATGDVGFADEHGYLFLVDRVKDVLISGGLNVYPSEIERVLAEVPGVRDVAVIAVPDAHWGETPVAVVEPGSDGPPTSAALRDACDGRLARYKRPTRFVLCDALPRGGTGKVLKRVLREQWRRYDDVT